ncbi:hypothetical protein SEUCBS139899_001878 [Sporothrix eucalyptigena]|uniref:Uncharacterized protein n=1 Tax=Sporothrix eucalyptigena TaxID=1812306 RepID=A0ABP0C0Z2_9PEZI
MTIETSPQKAQPMEAEAVSKTTTVAQQPSVEPRPTAIIDNSEASLRGGNLSLGCHCCHGTLSFYKSCC